MPIIVGLEVAKTSILCCKLETDSIPKDLPHFARTYDPVTLLSDSTGAQQLLQLGDQYILEPTGDYSKIWIDLLKANGKPVLLVNPKRVRALKQYHGVASKSDRYDAAFLALYGAMNQSNPSAFLGDHAEDLREVCLHHQFLSRMTGNHQRRLWQLLSHQWPEVCRSGNGTKPQQNRRWLDPSPPALWRFIAEEKVRNQKQRQAQLDSSIGSGLSPLSKTLASQMCALEREQYLLEEKISALLENAAFGPYHKVFDRFGFADQTRAILLSRIYPFGQFLGPDSKPIVERVPSAKTGRMHRRNRSLGSFRLALGNGTQVYQSGQVYTEKAAGSKVARSALYMHIQSKVLMLGARGLAQPERLREHSAYCRGLVGVPHKLAVSKTVAKAVKDLYHDLLAAHV